MSIKEGNGINKKEFGTNLEIYNKLNQCLLKDGEYECIVEEMIFQNPCAEVVNKRAAWERLKVNNIFNLTKF